MSDKKRVFITEGYKPTPVIVSPATKPTTSSNTTSQPAPKK